MIAYMERIPLAYALPDIRRIRRPSTWLDRLYVSCVTACYVMCWYAASIMPGGSSWTFEWDLANFLLTVAAFSSGVLCLAGLREVIWIGPKRCNRGILWGAIAAGTLPPMMLAFCQRWLQLNFA